MTDSTSEEENVFVFNDPLTLRRMQELEEQDPEAAQRLRWLLFHLRVNSPPISLLQTGLWTC